MLELKNPLIIFDIESTGVNTFKDRIIEIYLIKIFPDLSEEHLHFYFNPGIPIPAEATAIHGIRDEDVKDMPNFTEKAHQLNSFFEKCDLGGFNSNKFDVPILVEEFYRAGIQFELEKRKFVDVMRIYHTMEPRNLSAAYKYYCDKELDNAHSAKYDTIATYEILKAQIEKYPELDSNTDALHEISIQGNLVDLAGRIAYNEKKEEVFNFGKHKGKPVREVFKKESSYYDWMMQSEFPANTKNILTRIRLSMLKEQ
ncbi:MAG: 3'-5' exonuclease [Flavobacteriales bacterium]|nr:3'-5' exonuclease [Flavobacteriales bacterium]